MKASRKVIAYFVLGLFIATLVGIIIYVVAIKPEEPTTPTIPNSPIVPEDTPPVVNVFDIELWHCSLGEVNLVSSYDSTHGEPVNNTTRLFGNESGEKSIWAPNVSAGEVFRVINVGTIDLIYQFNIKVTNISSNLTARPITEALSVRVLEIESIVGQMPNVVPNGINYQGDFCDEGYTFEKSLRASEYADFSMIVSWISTSEDVNFAEDNGLSALISINIVAVPFSEQPDFTNIDNQQYVDFIINGGGSIVDESVRDVSIDIKQNDVVELDITGKDICGATDIETIINSGTLTLCGDGAIESQAPILKNVGNATLRDVTAVCTEQYYGIVTKGDEAITVVDNIVYYGERGALSVIDGKLIFNSGSVTVDGYGGAVGHVVYADGTAEIIINDGTFKHNRNCTKGAMIYAGGDSVIVVNGGSFTKGPNDYIGQWIKVVDNGQVIIKGGTFEFDPSEYVATGYHVQKNSKGWYDVVQTT